MDIWIGANHLPLTSPSTCNTFLTGENYLYEVQDMNATFSIIGLLVVFGVVGLVPAVIVIVLAYSIYRNSKMVAAKQLELEQSLGVLLEKTAHIEKMLEDVQ